MAELVIMEAAADDPNDHYPPKGTPETCLIIAIDSDNFRTLAHTGRFFHAQLNCAGFDGEELGLEGVPDEPGFWVMEAGQTWSHRDWETGIVDDYGCGGVWRPALATDFIAFGLTVPPIGLFAKDRANG